MRTDRAGDASERDGFALVMVVMLLFMVAVAGATGYQLVSAENELTLGVEAQEQALAAARAGMERYVGEHLGVAGVATTYAVGSASVTVTQKKVLSLDSITDLYVLESVGTMPDARYPSSPATRTIRQYAKLHLMPVYPFGALMSVATNMTIAAGDSIFGNHNTVDANCASATSGWKSNGPNDIYGSISLNASTGGTVNGRTPPANSRKTLASIQTVIDSAKVRWSALKSSQLSVGTLDSSSLPSQATFDALPADSFPIVRVNGNLSLPSGVRQGRGVLIVTGQISQSTFALSFFTWKGIILAASAGTLGGSFNSFYVDGMVVLGMDGAAQATQTISGNSRVWNCTYNIQRADRSIAYFELVDGSRWEF
jgi:hypothetical protein